MKEDAQSIIEAKKLFKDEEVMVQLTIIRANFQVVVHTITSLEERLPLVQSMQLVENLVEKLKLEPFATKLADVLSKNPGYAKAQKISKLLRGSQEDHEGLDDPNSSANMGNCPIVSCDVERSSLINLSGEMHPLVLCTINAVLVGFMSAKAAHTQLYGDGAPYCIKAGLGLKSLCPNMLHIT
eukprot:maker-scaffold967_size75526-snap-gene-0.11 protein:Tk01306 transcript:maker-scaffold967_size75526-snap-gene-0.11-mRNA-1 annotation:"PREDICTED: uncharacterized protein LOC100573760"